MHVCVATSVSIRTNLKPDLISFPVHITLLSVTFVPVVNNVKATITLVS